MIIFIRMTTIIMLIMIVRERNTMSICENKCQVIDCDLNRFSRVLLNNWIGSRVTPIDQLATDVLRQPNVECKWSWQVVVRSSRYPLSRTDAIPLAFQHHQARIIKFYFNDDTYSYIFYTRIIEFFLRSFRDDILDMGIYNRTTRSAMDGTYIIITIYYLYII